MEHDLIIFIHEDLGVLSPPFLVFCFNFKLKKVFLILIRKGDDIHIIHIPVFAAEGFLWKLHDDISIFFQNGDLIKKDTFGNLDDGSCLDDACVDVFKFDVHNLPYLSNIYEHIFKPFLMNVKWFSAINSLESDTAELVIVIFV